LDHVLTTGINLKQRSLKRGNTKFQDCIGK
jgi:hypothetical protein